MDSRLSPDIFALTALLALLTALGPLAMDLYLPSLPAIEAALAASVIGRSGGFLAYLGLATASYAGLFAYISGSSFVLQGVYGLSPMAFGLFYGVTSLGFIAGTLSGAKLVTRHGFDRTIWAGAAALASGGVLLMACVALVPSSIVAVAAPMMIFLAGLGLVLPLSMAAALQPFPERAGAASSFLGAVQQTAGAIVGVIVGHALGASGWPMIVAVAAAGSLTLLLWFVTRTIRTQAVKPRA
jgi:MFS transporter, DHA1 family, multidrug resistance protein